MNEKDSIDALKAWSAAIQSKLKPLSLAIQRLNRLETIQSAGVQLQLIGFESEQDMHTGLSVAAENPHKTHLLIALAAMDDMDIAGVPEPADVLLTATYFRLEPLPSTPDEIEFAFGISRLDKRHDDGGEHDYVEPVTWLNPPVSYVSNLDAMVLEHLGPALQEFFGKDVMAELKQRSKGPDGPKNG